MEFKRNSGDDGVKRNTALLTLMSLWTILRPVSQLRQGALNWDLEIYGSRR